MNLRILSKAGEILNVTTDYVLLPAGTGQTGILPGHAAMTVLVKNGTLKYSGGGLIKDIDLGSGIAEVANDNILIMT